ncbi:MAG: hypothetical protein AAB536_01950 [Patescibacteria group bacterium]
MTKPILFVGGIIIVIVTISTGAYFYFHRVPTLNVIENIPVSGEQEAIQSSGETPGIAQEATSPNKAEKSGPLVVREIHQEWAANYADNKILVGSSHNVFVGKIIEQAGNKSRSGPETQFVADVLYNIKGDLQGKIIINQPGGYIDGVLYVVGGVNYGDLLVPADRPEAGYMLQPGWTYLLATRYSEKEKWYTVNSFPRVTKVTSENPNLSNAQLRELAENDPSVKALLEAYPNESLLASDIARNDTKNSFQSLSPEEKQTVYDRISVFSPLPPSPVPTSTPTSTNQ